MANILDRYGIKEVADVTFYEINDDGSRGNPVLYLDTLKVSTIEQTAENTSARGGKGNPELIMWDYNKEITLTLEDALFSMKSMALMFGDADGAGSGTESIYRTVVLTTDNSCSLPSTYIRADGSKTSLPTSGVSYFDAKGSTVSVADLESNSKYMVCFTEETVTATSIQQIEISPTTFPGSYYITGDTYARKEADGKDECFQFVVQKAKVNSEVTLTMEAEGDPTTFSMTLKVLRPVSGPMMKLVKYSF